MENDKFEMIKQDYGIVRANPRDRHVLEGTITEAVRYLHDAGNHIDFGKVVVVYDMIQELEKLR